MNVSISEDDTGICFMKQSTSVTFADIRKE